VTKLLSVTFQILVPVNIIHKITYR